MPTSTDIRAKFRSLSEARSTLDAPASQPEPLPKPTYAPRPNKFAGLCQLCGVRVEAGAGSVTKIDGNWAVLHLLGACPAPVVQEAAVEPQEATETGDRHVNPLDPRNPWVGVYTVPFSDDPDDYLAFEVSVQDADASFAPGETILAQLVGSERESVSLGFLKAGTFRPWKSRQSKVTERVTEAVRRILAKDPSVIEARACVRCGELLTRPDSIALGIGPTCRQAWGW